MRRPNNPMLRQIERAENRQMIRELARGLLYICIAFLLVWGFFHVFAPADPGTGTIVEDNRGPELRKLMDAAMRPQEGR